MRSLLSALALVLPLVACGGDDDGAPTVDAPPGTIDAAVPDAPPMASTCEEYCTCMMGNCPNEFSNDLGGDVAACVSMCEALPAATQDCRAYHCSVAVGAMAATHCPHAIGVGMCM